MDKINPKLRLHHPYSVTGKMRGFPKAHYINNSSLLRVGLFVMLPAIVWSYSKIEAAVHSPLGYGYLNKRLATYEKNKPFKTITEDMVN